MDWNVVFLVCFSLSTGAVLVDGASAPGQRLLKRVEEIPQNPGQDGVIKQTHQEWDDHRRHACQHKRNHTVITQQYFYELIKSWYAGTQSDNTLNIQPWKITECHRKQQPENKSHVYLFRENSACLTAVKTMLGCWLDKAGPIKNT